MTLLIHPGFHKTGTTWLQERLFADRRLFNLLFDHHELFDLLAKPHDFHFGAAEAAQAIDGRRSAPSSGLIDVISSETLCGNCFTGQRDSKVIADRLAQCTGSAKVLLTVRAQAPILKSIYLQYVKRGGGMTLDEYLQFQPEPGYFHFEPKQLEFHTLAEHYGRLYGDENVLVLPQEQLFRDRDNYVDTLVRFATGAPMPAGMKAPDGKNVGKSPPASGVFLLRMASHFRRTPMSLTPILQWSLLSRLLQSAGYRWTLGKSTADARMKQLVTRFVAGRYGVSNARLQRYCPFDLGELGYELEAGDAELDIPDRGPA